MRALQSCAGLCWHVGIGMVGHGQARCRSWERAARQAVHGSCCAALAAPPPLRQPSNISSRRRRPHLLQELGEKKRAKRERAELEEEERHQRALQEQIARAQELAAAQGGLRALGAGWVGSVGVERAGPRVG